jgi:hypothetical protein
MYIKFCMGSGPGLWACPLFTGQGQHATLARAADACGNGHSKLQELQANAPKRKAGDLDTVWMMPVTLVLPSDASAISSSASSSSASSSSSSSSSSASSSGGERNSRSRSGRSTGGGTADVGSDGSKLSRSPKDTSRQNNGELPSSSSSSSDSSSSSSSSSSRSTTPERKKAVLEARRVYAVYSGEITCVRKDTVADGGAVGGKCWRSLFWDVQGKSGDSTGQAGPIGLSWVPHGVGVLSITRRRARRRVPTGMGNAEQQVREYQEREEVFRGSFVKGARSGFGIIDYGNGQEFRGMWRRDEACVGVYTVDHAYGAKQIRQVSGGSQAAHGGLGTFAGDLRGGTRYGMLSLLGVRVDGKARRAYSFQDFSRDSHLFRKASLGGVLHGRFGMGCDARGEFWLQTYDAFAGWEEEEVEDEADPVLPGQGRGTDSADDADVARTIAEGQMPRAEVAAAERSVAVTDFDVPENIIRALSAIVEEGGNLLHQVCRRCTLHCRAFALLELIGRALMRSETGQRVHCCLT